MDKQDRYDSLFQYYAELKSLDWRLLKAQAKQESWFNPDVKNKYSGALGLAQFMRATWEEWRDGTPGIQATKILFSRRNPEHAIRAQAAYMKWLLSYKSKKYNVNGLSMEEALWAYNWGIGNVLKFIRQRAIYYTEEPYLPTETIDYSKRIFKYYEEYTNGS